MQKHLSEKEKSKLIALAEVALQNYEPIKESIVDVLDKSLRMARTISARAYIVKNPTDEKDVNDNN